MGLLDAIRRIAGSSSSSLQIAGPGGPIVEWPKALRPGDLQVSVFDVDNLTGNEVHVVGESNYQNVLLAASQGRTYYGPVVSDHVAVMIPEPTNQHDQNAVRIVLAAAGLVGYLSRDDAVAYRPAIDAAAATGHLVAATAQITGGWDRGDGDIGSFGALLHMGPPDVVLREIQQEVENS